MAILASNQTTLIDLTDGYSVHFTSDSVTFQGNTTGVEGTQSATTMIQALCGTEVRPCSVDVASITKPSGVGITSDGKSPMPTITITVNSSVTSNGVVIIPVNINNEVTINKAFAFSIAKRGQTGATGATGTSVRITSNTVTYQVSTSGTTQPTGTWQASVPTVPQGQYLWTKTVVNYSDGTTTTAYNVSFQGVNGAKGDKGDTGAQGVKGDKGDTGAPGKDAYNLTIMSSEGMVFKNSTGATVLNAIIFKGGVAQGEEVTRYVKWYKNGETTAFATGPSVSVSASDVENKMDYIAQLEM